MHSAILEEIDRQISVIAKIKTLCERIPNTVPRQFYVSTFGNGEIQWDGWNREPATFADLGTDGWVRHQDAYTTTTLDWVRTDEETGVVLRIKGIEQIEPKTVASPVPASAFEPKAELQAVS